MSFLKLPYYKDIKDKLTTIVRLNRIPHAQLFVDNDSSIAFHIVLSYIKYIVCNQKTSGDSCGACHLCRRINNFLEPSVYFSFPISKILRTKNMVSTSFLKEWREYMKTNKYPCIETWGQALNTGKKQFNIYKEEVYEISRYINTMPGDFKFIIIWLPEYMHINTANAMLKLLEEPSKNVFFILITKDIEQIPATIISRMQCHFVKPISQKQIISILSEKYQLQSKDIKEAASLCQGNINEAIKVISNTQIQDNFDIFKNWMRMCYSRNYLALISYAEEISKKDKESQKLFFRYCLKMFRNLILIFFETETELYTINQKEIDFLSKLHSYFAYEDLRDFIYEIEDFMSKIDRNVNTNINFLKTSIIFAKKFSKTKQCYLQSIKR